MHEGRTLGKLSQKVSCLPVLRGSYECRFRKPLAVGQSRQFPQKM